MVLNLFLNIYESAFLFQIRGFFVPVFSNVFKLGIRTEMQSMP